MSWFDCKISFERDTSEDGKVRQVKESYLVDAESFTEAEARLVEEMAGRGAFTIESARKVRLFDLHLDHKSRRYYKAKVGFISLDEKAGREKKKYVQMLVQADNIDLALEQVKERMESSLADYEIAAIAETAYLDVYPYKILR